ncbi:MAG: glycoside hydrolase family 32 protein [Armatimonadetes bacterium]|nr:glycoside hydrolase family 32 protein [Armatimonadota bacterium]
MLLPFLLATALHLMQTPIYQESLRPQFHFTPKTGWTNDPNGLAYFKGEYHLFFQHNPFGTAWGNMTWGHAVSKDLVHWTQLDEAIRPDALGTIFSGSAVVDRANTTGFGSKGKPPLVCIYTAAGGTNPESKGQPFTQCLAYSTNGRTFTKFDSNPVLSHVRAENRDPKVIWHAPSKRWVMALYLDASDYALFSSPDLKSWTKLCDVQMPGCGECPDFFPLGVDGWKGGGVAGRKHAGDYAEPSTAELPPFHTSTPPPSSKWVFWAANGRYQIGSFDGKSFKPETEVLQADWGPNSYAAQTYSDEPKGRRIQISWMQGGKYPGMPFNQQMSIPREMALRETPEGPRVCMAPIRELSRLRSAAVSKRNQVLKAAEALAFGAGDLLEVRLVVDRSKTGSLRLTLGSAVVSLDFAKGVLTCQGREAPLPKGDDPIDLAIIFDRTSVEAFACGGMVTLAGCFVPNGQPQSSPVLRLEATGASFKLPRLDSWILKSIWH